MNGVLTAERAELLELKPLCIVLLVLVCLIVPLLALCACEGQLITSTGLCHGPNTSETFVSLPYRAFLCRFARKLKKPPCGLAKRFYHSHPEKVNIILTSARSEFSLDIIDRDASVDHQNEKMVLKIRDLGDRRLPVAL